MQEYYEGEEVTEDQYHEFGFGLDEGCSLFKGDDDDEADGDDIMYDEYEGLDVQARQSIEDDFVFLGKEENVEEFFSYGQVEYEVRYAKLGRKEKRDEENMVERMTQEVRQGRLVDLLEVMEEDEAWASVKREHDRKLNEFKQGPRFLSESGMGLNRSKEFFFVLQGSAGSGKTYLLRKVVEYAELWDLSNRIILSSTSGQSATIMMDEDVAAAEGLKD
eukprot:Nk52_evm33s223 gene=Nk52_evmTU33s223